MTCSRCGKQWCWLCQSVYHPGYSCDNWKREKYIRPFKQAVAFVFFLAFVWTVVNFGLWIFETSVFSFIWQFIRYPFIGFWVVLNYAKYILFYIAEITTNTISKILPSSINSIAAELFTFTLSTLYSIYLFGWNYLYVPFDIVMNFGWSTIITVFSFIVRFFFYIVYYFLWTLLKIVTLPVTMIFGS